MPNETVIFRAFWIFVALSWMAAERQLAKKTKVRPEIVQTTAKKSSHGLWLTFIFAVISALYFKTQHWLPIPLDYTSRQCVGFIIFGSGILLRYSAIRELGGYFSTQLRVVTEHRIVKTGPYRFVRHPSYSGLMVALFGVGIAMGDFIGLLLMMVFVFAGLKNRIGYEESLMLQQADLDYRDYCRNTWKLIPWLY